MTITFCVIFRKIIFIYLVISVFLSVKRTFTSAGVSLNFQDIVKKSSLDNNTLLSVTKSQGFDYQQTSEQFPQLSTTSSSPETKTTIVINDDVDIKLENIKIDNDILLNNLRNQLINNVLGNDISSGSYRKNDEDDNKSEKLTETTTPTTFTDNENLVTKNGGLNLIAGGSIGGNNVIDKNDRIEAIEDKLPPVGDFSDLEANHDYDYDYDVSTYSFTALESDGTNYEESKPACILGTADEYLDWWIKENGTLSDQSKHVYLDLSFQYFTDSKLSRIASRMKTKLQDEIRFVSVANNNLERIPTRLLGVVNNSVEYLSLFGNNFHISESGVEAYVELPPLPTLKELDMRRCNINFLTGNSFLYLPSLERLYLSHNNLAYIHPETFMYLNTLVHLDLSYNNESSNSLSYGSSNPDPYSSFIDGLDLSETLFSQLENLTLLDLSYSKLTPISGRATAFLGSKLQQLSLCYTNFPILPPGIFNNTNIKVLDISGNPSISSHLFRSTFKGLDDKLEILAFQFSNVKHLVWLNQLKKLSILLLRGNNINQLTNETFQNIMNIEIMDLSSNHISNWYSRAFRHNTILKLVNLRDNNINMMTTEMYNDFYPLQFLAIGHNKFICSCTLREFIDMAAKNNCNVKCSVVPNIQDEIRDRRKSTMLSYQDISSAIFNGYYEHIEESYTNMKHLSESPMTTDSPISVNRTNRGEIVVRISTKNVEVTCNRSEEIQNCVDSYETLYSGTEQINFGFQLLDFDENDYGCINSTTNENYFFYELERCISERISTPPWEEIESGNTSISFFIKLTIIIIALITVYAVCYYKWFYIRYFFIILKNATVLTFLDKEKDLMRKDSVDNVEVPYTYDVFVSYCDEDRDWVLNEFLPNIEDSDEINVCLHERDFQVGLSILENIIACMDRSRALLLLVSESFLLSHWCQFEMHLAQYRLLETQREHLIIILLEDIPRRKRPKTLHYLMKIKTYIKWPTGDKKNPLKNIKDAENSGVEGVPQNLLIEERKLFWRRLKKALSSAGKNCLKQDDRKISVSHV